MLFMRTRCWFIIVLTALAIITPSCGETDVESLWRKQPITVDGDITDWEGGMMYFEEKQCSVGIVNDSTTLYISLSTSNRATRAKINAGGLTLWFDPLTGNQPGKANVSSEKNYGVHYPVGMAEFRGSSDWQQMRTRMAAETADGSQPSPERMLAFTGAVREMYGTVELFRTDTVRISTERAAKERGVRVGVRDTVDVFTVEVAIPLNGTPFALLPNGGRVGLQFETGELKIPSGSSNNSAGSGRPAGAMGGGGMRGSGSGAGMGGPPPGSIGGGENFRQPMRLGVMVKLAVK
jgi:hypothetical protein